MNRPRHNWGSLALAGLLVLGWTSLARAQESSEQERARRAAMALRLMQYTRWPDDAFENEKSPVIVTVLGESEARHLAALIRVGERVQGRSVVVRRLDPPPAAAAAEHWHKFRDALEGSHAIYIDSGFDAQLRRILEAARQAGVLTIGNVPNFAERGGMLGLVYRSGKYNIEANLSEIKKTRIVVSSQVLELAKIVSPEAGWLPMHRPVYVQGPWISLESSPRRIAWAGPAGPGPRKGAAAFHRI